MSASRTSAINCRSFGQLIEIDDGGTAAPVPGAIAYDDLLAANEPLPRIERSGDDLLLWYTGGTTGLPKGVLWHQGTLLNYGAVYAAGVIGRPVPETVPEAAECAIELLTRDTRPVPLLTTPLVHATAVHQANTWFSVGGMVTLLPAVRWTAPWCAPPSSASASPCSRSSVT